MSLASTPLSQSAPSLTFPRPTCSMNPIALVINEIVTVTSAMRKAARDNGSSGSFILGGASASEDGGGGLWGGLGGSRRRSAGVTERTGGDPLTVGFTKLRKDLVACADITLFDAPGLLAPFLAVIREPNVSGAITSLALSSITKILSYDLLTSTSPRLPLAFRDLAHTITKCKFEATDTAQDEVVLLRLLRVMELTFNGVGHTVLDDDSVCKMVEVALIMCYQMRLNEVLRRAAEMTLMGICQKIFERLKEIPVGEDEERGSVLEVEGLGTPSVGSEVSGHDGEVEQKPLLPELPEKQQGPILENGQKASIDTARTSNDTTAAAAAATTEDVYIRPYSLHSVREVLRTLNYLLDPHNLRHTNPMRLSALRILDVAFETAGAHITTFPSLHALISDDLCRYLFQLVKMDHPLILGMTLKVVSTLLHTCRTGLKLQQEVFLEYVVGCLHPHSRLNNNELPKVPGVDAVFYEGIPVAPKIRMMSSGRSTPVPVKENKKLGMGPAMRGMDVLEMMVECVSGLMRIPSYMVDLFVNYDCDVDRMDLCEDVVGLLSRNAVPDAQSIAASVSAGGASISPLCLDALLAYVRFMFERLESLPVDEQQHEGYPSPEVLLRQRERKQTIIKGASIFNEKPKDGIKYLAEQGIVEDASDPKAIAAFFKATTRINKALLGEYLAKPANKDTLYAFIDLFDFHDMRIDEALREMLQKFRLPGESQQIERVVEKFASRFHECNPEGPVATADAAFVLSYSVIMLNTDLHNPQVKKRMAIEDYMRNLRAVNDGKDFEKEYLQAVYDAIANNEIIIAEEHGDTKAGFETAWKELMMKTESTGSLTICDTNIYDKHMFAATWKPLISTLACVFATTTDDAVFSGVITGFKQCAHIAAQYELYDVLDHIILCLAKISTLATDEPPSTEANVEVETEGQKITVSKLAVDFGRNDRAMQAAFVLFAVCKGHEQMIRKGWKQILRICLTLFRNGLLPETFSPIRQFLVIQPIPLKAPVEKKTNQNQQVGLFATFASYLSSGADEPAPPSREEVEATIIAADCIDACHLEDIGANIMALDIAAAKQLLESGLVYASIEEEVAQPVPIPAEQAASKTRSDASQALGAEEKKSIYDPSKLLMLEIASGLALHEGSSELLADVFEALRDIVRQSSRVHELMVERSFAYLLRLCKTPETIDALRLQLVLQDVATVGSTILQKIAPSIATGIVDLLKSPAPSSSSAETISNAPEELFAIIRSIFGNHNCHPQIFEIAEVLATETHGAKLTPENFPHVVELLAAFATLGEIGAQAEQMQDVALRKGTSPNASKDKKPHSSVVSRSVASVELLYGIYFRISRLSQDDQKAWTRYYTPLLEALGLECTNPCRQIRASAFSHLQRLLLEPIPAAEGPWIEDVFDKVLIELIKSLLRPEVAASDKRGMAESRVLAGSMLGKVFLRHLSTLVTKEDFVDLWMRIVDALESLMKKSGDDEAIVESLKNVVLVMKTQTEGMPVERQAEVWKRTWERLAKFLPGLKEELEPEVPTNEDTKNDEERKGPEQDQVTEEAEKERKALSG
ncbi:GDP/GTP exchange factor for ARF [Saitoella coloradoensis]